MENNGVIFIVRKPIPVEGNWPIPPGTVLREVERLEADEIPDVMEIVTYYVVSPPHGTNYPQPGTKIIVYVSQRALLIQEE